MTNRIKSKDKNETILCLYIKCSDGSYYTGVTSNITKRVYEHQVGHYPDCYTINRRPIELVFYCEFTDINLAIEKEKQIKKWSRMKKEALINGDFDTLVNLSKKRFDN
nr:GIY-YIG nuclease family protein [Flavobacterium hibisci]